MTIARKFKPLRDYLRDNAATYQSMSVSDTVSALNAPSITEYNRMSISDLQEQLTVLGKAINVATFLESTDSETAGLRRYLDMLLNGQQSDFNLMHASAQALLDQLVSLGILNASDKSALEAFVTQKKSIVENVGINIPVNAAQITTIRGDLGWG